MIFATQKERDYFARIARANLLLENSQPPVSLRESLARNEQLLAIDARMGGSALSNKGANKEGSNAENDGDLDEHLAYLKGLRARRAPAASSPADDEHLA